MGIAIRMDWIVDSGGRMYLADFGFFAGEESLDVFAVAEDDEQGDEGGGDDEGPEVGGAPAWDGENAEDQRDGEHQGGADGR